MITIKNTWDLIEQRCDFALQRHLAHVGSAMEALAMALGYAKEAENWKISGLLHDIDWNQTITNPEQHCGLETMAVLTKHGVPQEIQSVIQSHCPWLNIPRDNDQKKALFAVDELSGFIVASALMRPTKMVGITAKSVIKKMKDKRFAAVVNREDMKSCEKYFQIPIADFINVLLPGFEKIAQKWQLTTKND